jgi:tetratricopeptide (TPR) repeat protein
MKALFVLIGLAALAGGGFFAYQFLNADEDEKVAMPDINQTTGSKTATLTKDAASAESAAKEEKQKEHKCKPLSDYPKFAWLSTLETLAKASNKSSICGLFGVSKEDVVTAMRGALTFGPTGYDLLPRATVFEVFPLGKAERRAPSMELIFIDDLLFEIRMNYAMSDNSSLDPEMFKPALGAPKVVTDDPLSRDIKIYTDEDMVIFWYKKTDPYKRVFNEVVFSSRLVRAGLEKELKDRSDAQNAFEQGMVLFNQKQPMRAVDKFKDARKIIPKMGTAYIFEGLALLQKEQFDKLEALAVSAFENSTDDRSRAGAKGLQAVAALYHGDKEGALSLFNNAAVLDPADAEFSTAVEELKTGEYDASRVAKTAARMDCRQNHSEWSVKGLLARGNFPDDDTFEKAKKSAKKKPGYKAAFDMWNAWECN